MSGSEYASGQGPESAKAKALPSAAWPPPAHAQAAGHLAGSPQSAQSLPSLHPCSRSISVMNSLVHVSSFHINGRLSIVSELPTNTSIPCFRDLGRHRCRRNKRKEMASYQDLLSEAALGTCQTSYLPFIVAHEASISTCFLRRTLRPKITSSESIRAGIHIQACLSAEVALAAADTP